MIWAVAIALQSAPTHASRGYHYLPYLDLLADHPNGLVLHVEIVGPREVTLDGQPVMMTRVITPYVGSVESGFIEVVGRNADPEGWDSLHPGDRLIVAGQPTNQIGRWLLEPTTYQAALLRIEPVGYHGGTRVWPYLCPVGNAACPVDQGVVVAVPWYGLVYEHFRAHSLGERRTKGAQISGSSAPNGWAAIQRPVATLLSLNELEGIASLVDLVTHVKVETLECDSSIGDGCIVRGRAQWDESSPPWNNPGDTIEVALPPEFCALVADSLQVTMFMNWNNVQTTWTLVDLNVSARDMPARGPDTLTGRVYRHYLPNTDSFRRESQASCTQE